MISFTAFLHAIIIGSSILSCVCSLPTHNQGFEAVLDEGSSISEEYSKCFELVETSFSEEIRNMNFAVDSEGKLCFARLDSRHFPNLLNNADEIDGRVANITSEFCPKWPPSKQCLMDHLISDRCNAADRKTAMDLKSLNEDIVFAELLCNPQRKSIFLNLVKSMLKERLFECFELEETKNLSRECLRMKSEENGHRATFQELSHFFQCSKPGLRKCASGDPVKEAKFLQLWEEFDRELQGAHWDFWN